MRLFLLVSGSVSDEYRHYHLPSSIEFVRDSSHVRRWHVNPCRFGHLGCWRYRALGAIFNAQHRSNFHRLHHRAFPHPTFRYYQGLCDLFTRYALSCSIQHCNQLLINVYTVTFVWLIVLFVTGIYNVIAFPGIWRAYDPSRAVLCKLAAPLAFLSTNCVLVVRVRAYRAV